MVCCLDADQSFKCVPAYLESHYGNWIGEYDKRTVNVMHGPVHSLPAWGGEAKLPDFRRIIQYMVSFEMVI